MQAGFKYFVNPHSNKGRVTHEHLLGKLDSEALKQLCHHEQDSPLLFTADDFKARLVANTFLAEMNATYRSVLDPNRLVVGLGSGYGEHELLLHWQGYQIIATDVIPGLSEQTSQLFPDFKTTTLDVFSDDIRDAVSCKLGANHDFDVFVCGLDFFFDDTRTAELFRRISTALAPGAHCVFSLRYRDHPLTSVQEKVILLEAYATAFLKKKEIVYHQHGYRRSERDILKLASGAGLRCQDARPIVLGGDCVRSVAFSKLYWLFRASDRFLVPLFNYATIFKFEKI